MKFKDISKMKQAEQEKRLAEIRLELLKLNGQVATGTSPKNPLEVRSFSKVMLKIKSL